MIRETGVKLNELLDVYDDAEKEVATRLPDGSTKLVPVNRMTGHAPTGEPAYGPDDLRFDPAHRHTITISTGPSRDSQREAGKDAAMALMDNPQAFPIIAADAVKLMDLGPIGDQMAKDLEFLQPPVMQQARQQEAGGAPDPRQLQQQLGQAKQQLQHLEQAAQQMHQALTGKRAEIASKEKIAAAELTGKHALEIQLQTMKDATAIAIAHIAAAAKGAALDAHAAEEAQALGHAAAISGLQVEADATEAEAARQHAAQQAAAAQQHQAGMAAAGADAAANAQALGHAQTLDAGEAGHQQMLEQGQQAADLAPAPEPTGSAD